MTTPTQSHKLLIASMIPTTFLLGCASSQVATQPADTTPADSPTANAHPTVASADTSGPTTPTAQASAAPAPPTHAQVGQPMNATITNAPTATLWVKGMTCPFCMNNVDLQLGLVPGVEDVQIDLSSGKVTIAMDADQPAKRADLVRAIDNSGFTLDKIEMPR